jgi:hypothetical protein
MGLLGKVRTMDGEGYNGWKNYETWNVALWIDNEQGAQNYAYELTRDAVEAHEARTGYGTTVEGSLAHYLKEWVEEMRPDLGATMFADLLGAALSKVDWFELARNYLETLEEVDA